MNLVCQHSIYTRTKDRNSIEQDFNYKALFFLKGSDENKEIDDQKEFEIGTHILIIPMKSPDAKDIQYTFHEGYELVDIAFTSEVHNGNDALAMYVNTEKVKCKKLVLMKKLVKVNSMNLVHLS